MDIRVTFLNGSTYPLEKVSSSTTVGELKKLIQEKSGDTPACQKLSNGEVDFSNDSSTLGDIDLKSGSSVMVLLQDPAPFQVFLKNIEGRTSTYDVVPDETVTSFKNKVYNKERVPEDQQRLIHEGKQLEDGRKLKDYNIVSGSTIYRTFRLRGG